LLKKPLIHLNVCRARDFGPAASISALRKAAHRSGVLPTDSVASAAKRCSTSGSCTMRATSRDSATTISFEVRAGQYADPAREFISGTPDSAIVGVSGNAGERLGVVTASSRSLPSRADGSVDDGLPKTTCMCSPSKSVTACGRPLRARARY
jgi:hypothetical protein